jgi:Domain of unknown function (DUF4912)
MDDRDLPVSYGKTRLVLLAVDPYLIHAYWEVTPEKLIEAMEAAGEVQAVLRFYKPGKTAGENAPADWFDVEIDLQSRNWYVHLWSAEESYSADLALKRNDGTLVRLVQSQVVHMPRTRPAIAIEQRFMKVEPIRRRAEIVPPPPAGFHRPREAATPLAGDLNVRRPTAGPADSAEIVREKLAELHASHERRREQFEPESVRAANISNPPPGRATIDLTAMAERKLAAGTSSGAFQKSLQGGSDKKR